MGRSGRKRKRKDKRDQEEEEKLLVVQSDYRPPKRSHGRWKKRLKDLREAEEEKKEARDKALAEAWPKVWETDVSLRMELGFVLVLF